MAVDEALLASAARGGAPTLRLYAWDGAWLSLGYAQRLDPDRLARCADAGVGVVRRASGGGAVLHGGDLTYAVAAPQDALPPGLHGAYAAIVEGLVAALRALGVDAQRAHDGPARPGYACFAHAGEDAVCAGGRKLCGSAQRRVRGGVLQHGSLRLAPDPEPARRAAGLPAAGATSLAELAVTPAPGALETALLEGLAASLGADFAPGALAGPERRAAEQGLAAPRLQVHGSASPAQ